MKRVLSVSMLLFAAYLIISLSRSLWDLWQKQENLLKAQTNVERLRQENNRLQSELEYVQTDEFVEREAREKLKLVKPNETVVLIPENVLRAATASAVPTPAPPNWEQWMRLFF